MSASLCMRRRKKSKNNEKGEKKAHAHANAHTHALTLLILIVYLHRDASAFEGGETLWLLLNHAKLRAPGAPERKRIFEVFRLMLDVFSKFSS